ncbi:hypothetical protein [Paenibacillus popilliae]|uniref:Phosphodiester glycosidase domain-containing protein n=1 Tax=Paenibacillus popilliae TaxID=78057 RepID=A0ABY3AW49_PAEPP|nr:hypothetical protein [Paenibacillus sp. SDF0028]TQR46735.1 hypothetical protein C7Y44_03515 [Paenibacillus sp. SDF0028]
MVIENSVKKSGLLLLMICTVLALFAPNVQAANSYTYEQKKAKDGTVLHVISTDPSNIQFKLLNGKSTLANSGYYGINGGYFTFGKKDETLHIAVMDDKTVTGKGQWVPNSGGYNGISTGKKGGGTIVWDGKTDTLSLQDVHGMGDIKVSNRNNYWAQGGVSMTLNDDEKWKKIANDEGIAGMTQKKERTAMLFESGSKDSKIKLIVTNNEITASAFRAAIKEKYGSGAKAIFLDGSDSSQLKCKEATIEGNEKRNLQQIIVLKNTK